MKLAELIISEAHERGLRHLFGIPGSGSPMDMMEAARQRGMTFVSTSHESSAGIAAAYYGLLKGTTGLALAIKGVGAANLAGGLANAHFERAPVVAVVEGSASTITAREMVQHSDDVTLLTPITKYQATLLATTAPAQVQEAVFRSLDGRPGPVLLRVPNDQSQQEAGDVLPVKSPTRPAPPAADALSAAPQAVIARSRKPVVIAGADVIRHSATGALRAFVERIGAAVLVGMDGRGAFPETHPLWAGTFLGMYGPNIIETETLAQGDLVILVGADPMMTHVPWKPTLPTLELVARAGYDTLSPDPQVRVDGDLRASLTALTVASGGGFSADEVRALREKILRHFQRPGQARLAAQDIIAISRATLPHEGALFSESAAFVVMLETLYAVTQPGTFFGSSGGRTMGLMLPAILGGALADPERPKLGIGADGSLLMRLGDLEAFARLSIAVPLVIINDRALGTMKSRQRSRGLPEYSLDLHPVDFAQVARACGLNGVTVETPEAFEKALRQAMVADKTTLIDARVDPRPYQDSFGPTIGVLS